MDANTWKIISIVGYSLAGGLFVAAIVMFFKMNILAIIGDLTGKTAARQIQEIRERNTLTGNKRHQPDAFNLERGALIDKVIRPGKSGKMGKTAQALAHASKRLDLKEKTQETSRTNVKDVKNIEGLPNRKLTRDSSGTLVLVEAAAGSSKTEVATESTKVLCNGTEGLTESTVVLNNNLKVRTDGTEVRDNDTEVVAESKKVLDSGTELLTESTEVLGNGTELLPESTQLLDYDDGTEVLQDEGTTVLYQTAELEEEVIQPVDFKIVKDILVIHTNEVI